MSHHLNRAGGIKPEVKSKIGDYIRGKISARSLMHPSRLNTKPIDKRRYNLNAGIHQPEVTSSIRPEYQRKVRRPPLKDYIEGKVKLSDMISPSRITFIPKERKYNVADTTTTTSAADQFEAAGFHYKQSSVASPFEEAIKIVTIGNGGGSVLSATDDVKSGGGGGGGGNEWRPSSSKMQLDNELTLVPIRNMARNGGSSSSKRKLMCKIKVQQSTASAYGTTETKTREHVIEIPQKLLRDNRGLPKFLMDRYNIPCYVDKATAAATTTTTSAVGGSVKRVCKSKPPSLAITSNNGTAVVTDDDTASDTAYERSCVTPVQAIEYRLPSSSPSLANSVNMAAALPTTEDDDQVVDTRIETSNDNGELDNLLPSDQGDHNNPTTTYVFEFYEEDATSSMGGGGRANKSAIIEEIDDERADSGRRSYMEDILRGGGGGSRTCLPETPRSGDRFHYQHHQYDDFKSNIYFQRELIDLHRELLKFDKSVMGVERNVHQMTAVLNTVESVQNDELRPIVTTIKTDNDRIKNKITRLENENDDLKKALRFLRRKTCDYDRLICYLTRNNNTKMRQLEDKLTTITQAQLKSIMMQNAVNKNIFQLTKDIKKTYTSEQDSKIDNSLKSPKDDTTMTVS